MEAPAPSVGFERKEAVLIINPAAHNVPALKLRREAEEWLREAGWRFRWEQTTEGGHATRIAARAAAQRVPLVLACGGDGTLNEVANGLAGTETALGTLPGGTSNIWARETGISRKPVEAARLMATGERRLIDLGKAGDRYFMLFAGIGVDAQVTRNVSLNMKRRVGAAAYGVAAIREAMRWRSRPMTVRLDGVEQRLDVLMAFAGNTRLYAGLTRITPDAIVDDGLLDVVIYQGSGRLDIAMHLARTLRQSHGRARKVLTQRVKRMEFDCDDPLPVQMDGDPVSSDCPREIVVAPRALWVVVPAGLRTGLFAGPGGQPQEAELSLPRRQTS